MSAPPGWYQDPDGPHGHHRWWDGTSWTEQRVAPTGAQVPAAWNPVRFARRHPLATVLAALFGLVVIYGAVDSADEQPTVHDRTTSDNEAGAPTEPEDQPRTYVVSRIVDGDTLELGNGETVRLVGIDAPETGACGHERAADDLARLVLDKAVLLGESDEDRDRYGRLLRYIDIGSQDAGLRLIKNGVAIARYDSRDGYGFHPRERQYIAADEGAKQFVCAPKLQPFVQQPPAGANCAPGYQPCVPPYPPDLDCPDVNGPIHVSGSDPHGLDADGDGVACE
ncbi:MAG TPA: thermonuclease family protein [Nocardioides sp.]|nr:thermonuclease family protein [Nocardioides sp.]